MIPDQDQTICTNPEFSMAPCTHQIPPGFIELALAVIDHDKIIPGSLVFEKLNCRHTCKDKLPAAE
jgi:hypothetical protein